tara:strand:+ start:2728 stop:2928 length:201 start_codon:yes stop_codon:yes gene_type:complete
MEAFLIGVALSLGIVNALLPIAKRIVRNTKTKKDDRVVEIIEEALQLAKVLQKEKKAIDKAKKKST